MSGSISVTSQATSAAPEQRSKIKLYRRSLTPMLAQSLLFSSQVMHGLRGVTPPGKLYQNDAALGNTRGNAEILSFSFFFLAAET